MCVCVFAHLLMGKFPLLPVAAAWRCIKQKKAPSMRSPTTGLMKGALYRGLNAVGLRSTEIQFLKVPEAENL